MWLTRQPSLALAESPESKGSSRKSRNPSAEDDGGERSSTHDADRRRDWFGAAYGRWHSAKWEAKIAKLLAAGAH
jgi:hypothetical protein